MVGGERKVLFEVHEAGKTGASQPIEQRVNDGAGGAPRAASGRTTDLAVTREN